MFKKGFLHSAVSMFSQDAVFSLVVFANVGLLLAFKARKPWPVDRAFGMAFILNSAYGIIVIPDPHYILGFIITAVLYGIISINFAVQKGALFPCKN